MQPVSRDAILNRLLLQLSNAEFSLLQSNLVPVDLPKDLVLAGADSPVEHIYFFNSGIASVVGDRPNGHRIEVGIIGKEGFSGMSPMLGVTHTPVEIMMQFAGDGYRVSTAEFLSAVRSSQSLNDLMLRFVHVFHFQTVQTALSNSSANIDERMARWLLMCQDRIGTRILDVTHRFLAMMLGVRRSSVTDAIHILEGRGLIRSERGKIEIWDRARLEKLAGASYGPSEDEYERVIGRS